MSMTLAELYDAWALTLHASRYKTARAHRPYIVDALGALTHRKLTPAALLAWRDGLPRELSPGYRQNIRTTLCSCLAYHVKVGGVPSNPLAGLPRDKEVDNNRQGYFTPEALASFLGHCNPILRDICIVTATCGGLRASEVLGLRIDQIDHAARKLVVPQKGGTKKRVIAPDAAYSLICERLRISGSWWVFPSVTDPSRHVPYSTMAHWFSEAADSWGGNLLGEGAVHHMLRHGYIMEMLKTMPVHWIASQTGHKNSRQIEQRYGVLRGDAELQARQMINGSGLVAVGFETKEAAQ